jgi:hypothetical protein
VESDVTNKLRGAITGDLSEAQVVYILTLFRKLLDYRGSKQNFYYLRFFSDWAFHVRVDRAAAKLVLRHFDEWFPTLAGNNGRAAQACRFLLLFEFHLEFIWLLRDARLPEITNEWWCEFLRLYLEVIADSPVSSNVDLGLEYLKELAIERVAKESGVNYCWKLTLKTEDIRRFPLDPDGFFGEGPTHVGEPWLWKGPVAAMVGLPEGWVTDRTLGHR